jgi:lipopolysaccharide transport system ATP-binding protein
MLGLTQREVRKRFDEIVDFSGIESFIDVPVKRYSSGMYVRLAYSVTSLLRSDILMLDEVMAVGDAAFREKSKRNIEAAAKDGRTVLFVSHNARAISNMCKSGMLLSQGNCLFSGSVTDALSAYEKLLNGDDASDQPEGAFKDIWQAPRHQPNSLRTLAWLSTHAADGTPTSKFNTGEPIQFRVGFRNASEARPYIAILIYNSIGEQVTYIDSTHDPAPPKIVGTGYVTCNIDDLRLGGGTYRVMADYGSTLGHFGTSISKDCVPNAGQIEVSLNGFVRGVGVGFRDGAAHRSAWDSVLVAEDRPV